jgi:hypothetical protein
MQRSCLDKYVIISYGHSTISPDIILSLTVRCGDFQGTREFNISVFIFQSAKSRIVLTANILCIFNRVDLNMPCFLQRVV